jgi:integrase
MGRAGKRTRLERGIYREGHAIAATVQVGSVQRERRFPLSTDRATIRRWREETRVALRYADARPARGTLAAEVERYLAQVQYLDPATVRSRRSELAQWTAALGRVDRGALTADQVRPVLARWRAAGAAPKTLINRTRTLAHLYRTLDGRHAPTPVDDLELPAPPRRRPAVVTPAVIAAVEARLRAAEQPRGPHGTKAAQLPDAKTRARFMVLASCGMRPSQLKRLRPVDVDLARGVVLIAGGKGGHAVALPLNGDMRAAWALFVAADAWGAFDTRSFARRLYTAGWPRDVRPYNLRHSVGLALSEQGEDLADVQAWMGHTDIATTRRFYVPVLDSRLARASARLDGRLGWSQDASQDASQDSSQDASAHPAKS